jgi:hypothetical protein
MDRELGQRGGGFVYGLSVLAKNRPFNHTTGKPSQWGFLLKLQWFERLDFGGQHIANHCSFMCFPKSPKHTGNTLPPEAMGRPARPAPGLGEQLT